MPPKESSVSPLSLLETSCLWNLKEHLNCARHHVAYKTSIWTSQGVAFISLVCPSGCDEWVWSSSSEIPNFQRRKESRFRTTNQLVFSAVIENYGFSSYERFCKLLGIQGVSERVFLELSAKYLSTIPGLASSHFLEIRDFAQKEKDMSLLILPPFLFCLFS